jgi:two-component system, cell cycle sensor histidine kinase and response regulator CckA
VSKKLNILMLEDYPSDAALAEFSLRSAELDFESRRVETREAYIQALDEFKPDLILADYNLPNFTGLEALRLVRRQRPQTVFILVTGTQTEEVAVECMKEGADDYILKTSLKRLPSAVTNALKKRQAEWENLKSADERRRSEEIVRRSEELNRRILEAVPGGIVLVSTQGQILKANTEAQRILGLKYDELTAMYVGDFATTTISEDGSECKVVDYPVSRCLFTGEPQPAMTMGVRRPDGIMSWAIYTAIPMHDSHSGELTGAVVTFVDISERKRTENALRESEQRFRTLTESSPTGIWQITPDGQTIYANQALCQMLEVSDVSEIKGQSVRAYFTPDSMEKIIAENAKRERGIASHYELEMITRLGRKRNIIIHGAPMIGPDGKLQSRMGSVIDITDLKLAEDERRQLERKLLETQKLESLGVLAGGVAHDFNNLLAAVLGNVSLAGMHVDAESPARPYLTSIETTTHRAADLCKQMLAYSGRGRFVVQPVLVNAVIHEMVDLLKISVGKGINLNLRLSRDIPAIPADATQLRQIVMNLIINASEAIGERSGIISITTGVSRADRVSLTKSFLSPDFADGDYVTIEVSDTGCGMDEQTRSKVFDPFFTTKFTGRGLGLAAVLGIIRGHKGAVKVESAPGKGTTFRILLPCVKVQPVTPHVTPVPMLKPNGKVLVVDDDETLRTLQARMLEALGFSALLAHNGSEAIKIVSLQKEKIAAVLLDLTMPGMSGEETCLELCRVRPDLPVILMSGYEAQEVLDRIDNKRIRFLQKPFTPQNLRAELALVLSSKES